MDFEEWLYADGMTPATVRKYSGAIRGLLTTLANSYRLTDIALDQITDLDEFIEIAERVSDTPEFASSNKTGKHMYSAALQKYSAFLESIKDLIPEASGPWAAELASVAKESGTYPVFDPTNQVDARAKVLKEVVLRQGQTRFRTGLINAYEARCAFTQCAVLPTLEAAHITPYLGAATNRTENGLLLRADVHTLWDLGLVAIHPESNLICVAASILDDGYRALQGKSPFEPKSVLSKPSYAALQQQWGIFNKP